jgi:hypothetical protein
VAGEAISTPAVDPTRKWRVHRSSRGYLIVGAVLALPWPSTGRQPGFAGPLQEDLLLVIDVNDVELPSVRFDACGGTGESFTVSGYYVDTGPN